MGSKTLTESDLETILWALDRDLCEIRKNASTWRRRKKPLNAELCDQAFAKTLETAKRFHAHFEMPGELKVNP